MHYAPLQISRSSRGGDNMGMATLADLLWLAYRAPHYSVRGCFFPADQQMALIKGKQPLTEPLVCLVFLGPATVSQPK